MNISADFLSTPEPGSTLEKLTSPLVANRILEAFCSGRRDFNKYRGVYMVREGGVTLLNLHQKTVMVLSGKTVQLTPQFEADIAIKGLQEYDCR